MRKFYFLWCFFAAFPLLVNAQEYTSQELAEIQAHQQWASMELPNFNIPSFGDFEYGTEDVNEIFIPTAGATETFSPAVGDYFYDPGGPGGSSTGGDTGNYPNCGCDTFTTLEGVSNIQFNFFSVFGYFDYLQIYDGTDATGTKLYDNGTGGANYNDITLDDMIASHGSNSFTATSGNFYFVFHASTVVDYGGWEIEVIATDGGTGTGGNDEDCDQGDDSNGFENGHQIGSGTDYENADDFHVSADNTLNVQTIEINAIAMAGPVDSIGFTFYEDDGGAPGSTVVATVPQTVPYDQVLIGSAFGYDVYAIYVDVDLNFEGGTSGASYWMHPTAVAPGGEIGAVFWEVTSVGTLGAPSHTRTAGGPWEADPDGLNTVFKLHCEHVDPPTPPCTFSITNDIEPITRVVVSDIDHTSDATVNGSPALEDFTSVEGHVAAGESYDVALEGNTAGNFTTYFTIFVDWNQDGDMTDAGEMYEIGSITNSTGIDGQQATGNITVPADATEGATMMRVIKNFNSSPTNPCGTYGWGQAEDYTIVVGDVPPPTGDGCEWTVIVQDDDYFGDEVTWTLKDSDGTVLLSGGDYGEGYYDEQTVTAEGPLEFYISAIGFFDDNEPTYSVSNGTEVLVSGQLFGGDDATYSDLNCGDGPPPTGGPCDEKIIMECGETYTATLVPNAGEWTNYTGVTWNYPGSEQVYEFTAPTTGTYVFEVDEGANDADFFLMDACSNTANNLIGGYWTGLGDETIDLEGGTTYYLIADLFASSASTVTVKVNCPDGPPPTGGDCEQGVPSASTVPQAYNIEMSNLYRDAEDFTVDANGFTLETITIDVNQQEVPDYAEIIIREDVGGMPGGILHTITGAPNDSEEIGSAFGDPIYHLTFNLDTPIDLSEGTYWLDPKMATPSGETVWWAAVNYDSSHGAHPYRSVDDGATWTEDTVYSLVFTVSGTCGDVPPPGGDCSFSNPSNAFENGTPNSLYITANDFIVPAGESFTLEQLVPNILTLTEIQYADVYYYTDADGLPGTQIGDAQMAVPVTSQTVIGNAFGYDVREVVLDVTPHEFTEGTYWVRIDTPNADGSATYWEGTSATTVGSLAAGFDGTTWSIPSGWSGLDGVYTFNGQCEQLGVSNMNSFDFAYYPNPVKDVLTISSGKTIENVSAYNLAGQSVLNSAKVTNGQINVSALPTGVYVFRVTLQGGQIETFKIVKK